MKVCCRCKFKKEFTDFNKDKIFKDGLRPFCRECVKKENKLRYWNNINNEKERNKLRYWENIDNERIRGAKKYHSNKPYYRAKDAKRRAWKAQATPVWLDEIHFKQIEWYYIAAALFTNQTGVINHVDHIHPLQGKNFSGLHVPWNLRVIKGKENLSKRNNPPADEAHLFWGNV